MDPESFERMAALNKVVDVDYEEDDDDIDPEEQAIRDIQEAIKLLITARTLIDYVANPNICRTVSKRERDILTKVSDKLTNFLGSVVPTYTEG